jgi:hypothetical protein
MGRGILIVIGLAEADNSARSRASASERATAGPFASMSTPSRDASIGSR